MVYLQLRTGTKRSPVALLNGSDSSGDSGLECGKRFAARDHAIFPIPEIDSEL